MGKRGSSKHLAVLVYYIYTQRELFYLKKVTFTLFQKRKNSPRILQTKIRGINQEFPKVSMQFIFLKSQWKDDS